MRRCRRISGAKTRPHPLTARRRIPWETPPRTLVRESGNPGPFDAEAWVDRWLRRPNHALGGASPELHLNTPNGEELLSGLIGAMASGAYL